MFGPTPPIEKDEKTIVQMIVIKAPPEYSLVPSVILFPLKRHPK
jgi:hypothetical protein